MLAAGRVDRRSSHSPERLARKDAYQVLRVDECRRAGGEVIVLKRAWGHSPEEALRLQVQGMSAEYERPRASNGTGAARGMPRVLGRGMCGAGHRTGTAL